MFGRREEEKRSLEEMFTPVEDKVEIDECETEKEEVVDTVVENESEPIKPLSCFGMEEGKTEKWLIKCVKVWFCCMSFLWFLFGALTFAPVIYIGNKVNVIFKDKKKSLLFATLMYSVIALVLVLLILFR
jgi:hypothetical protein